MADITRTPLVPFVRHLRSDPNMYVRHLRKGEVAHEGAGTAFWFRPRTAALSQVPLDDREQALLFHARTADFQDVTVQATVNYRVVDPALATTRIDFGVNLDTGHWNGVPLETLGGLLTELAQQPAVERLATMTMRQALAAGLAPVRQVVAEALADDARLAERGITVSDVRVVAIRTDPEVERAMQTETREQVQQEADRATYERRARAVERERSIAENELANQIELARREEELVGQQGLNDRRRATEQAAAEAITAEAKAAERALLAEAEATERTLLAEAKAAENTLLAEAKAAENTLLAEAKAAENTLLGEAKAAATRMVGEAEAAAETARYEAFDGVDTSVMIALAAQELARNVPMVDRLTITPDVLTSLAATLSETVESAPKVGGG